MPVIVSVCWYDIERIDTGGKVRTFNILKYMRTFTPWIITPSAGENKSFLNAIEIRPRPLKIRKVFNGEILNYIWPDKVLQIRNTLQKISPDIVQSEGIWSFPAVYFYCRNFRRPSVLVVNNIEHRVAVRLCGGYLRKIVLRTLEKIFYRKADILVVCSNEDKRNIMKDFYIPERKIIVAPNGVDDKKNNLYRKDTSMPLLLFMGKLDYGPNREAVSFIVDTLMPRLRKIKCIIIGDGLGRKIHNRCIEYLGRVDDVGRYLNKADICIAPIWSGSGTRLKVLEYLSAARPLIATRKAVEGLGLEKGRHYLEAENVDEFEKAIEEILHNPERWERNAQDAREFVLSQYRWEKVVSDYEMRLRERLTFIDA